MEKVSVGLQEAESSFCKWGLGTGAGRVGSGQQGAFSIPPPPLFSYFFSPPFFFLSPSLSPVEKAPGHAAEGGCGKGTERVVMAAAGVSACCGTGTGEEVGATHTMLGTPHTTS